ncbi:MAG: hypothetical protein N2748_04280, partial [candidate division WOR-3 bacterium]|nr:hypothetical protein [candidate division WOR-3 bacterium]
VAPRNDILPFVFASASEAISLFTSLGDCFVASLLAMTVFSFVFASASEANSNNLIRIRLSMLKLNLYLILKTILKPNLTF